MRDKPAIVKAENPVCIVIDYHCTLTQKELPLRAAVMVNAVILRRYNAVILPTYWLGLFRGTAVN